MNEQKFVYRCEHCNIIVFKLNYAKNLECPFCKKNLSYTLISENSMMVNYLKTTESMTKETDSFIKYLQSIELELLEKVNLLNAIDTLIGCLNGLKKELTF